MSILMKKVDDMKLYDHKCMTNYKPILKILHNKGFINDHNYKSLKYGLIGFSSNEDVRFAKTFVISGNPV